MQWPLLKPIVKDSIQEQKVFCQQEWDTIGSARILTITTRSCCIIPIFQTRWHISDHRERNEVWNPPPALQSISFKEVSHLDHRVPPCWCFDSPPAPFGLIMGTVMGFRLHFNAEFIRARMTGEWPLKGWKRLHRNAGHHRGKKWLEHSYEVQRDQKKKSRQCTFYQHQVEKGNLARAPLMV